MEEHSMGIQCKRTILAVFSKISSFQELSCWISKFIPTKLLKTVDFELKTLQLEIYHYFACKKMSKSTLKTLFGESILKIINKYIFFLL